MGLGESRQSRIEVVGGSLRDLRMPWRRAGLRNRFATAQAACPGRSCTWRPMVG